MSFTWDPKDDPAKISITLAGWVRVGLRATVLSVIMIAGVLTTLILRLIEVPFFGLRRPMSPHIVQWFSRVVFLVLGIGHFVQGQRMKQPGAVVSNHSSWLDIFALNARKRVYFVSKSEVANWPGIGLLARMTGTVFIARDPRQAHAQTEVFEARLLAGHKLLFFPEGTSTDGLRVLPFKPTLFQAFFSEKLRHDMYIQPVSTVYQAPRGEDARFYGWWGDMDFGPHLLQLMAAARQGSVKIIYHPPVKVDAFKDRKALAAHVETVVRQGMPPERRIS